MHELKAAVIRELGHKPTFIVKHNQLIYKNRLVIPKHSSLIPQLMQESHESNVGSHSGPLETYKKIFGDILGRDE